MMRSVAVLMLLLPSLAPAVDVPPDCDLELRVGPAQLDLVANPAAFSATLTNRGSRSVVLVLPGDGSQEGDRTPIIEWEFTPRPRRALGYCANINALQRGEVFTLEPGQTRHVGAWAAPEIVGSAYRARMLYSNEPSLQWGGVPLGRHDKREMKRVRQSDRCGVVSNPVSIRGYRRAADS